MALYSECIKGEELEALGPEHEDLVVSLTNIERTVEHIQTTSLKFEPTREKLSLTMVLLLRKIQEYRSQLTR